MKHQNIHRELSSEEYLYSSIKKSYSGEVSYCQNSSFWEVNLLLV